jgi:hypothetical protein
MRAALLAILLLGCETSPKRLCEKMINVVGPDDPKDPKGSYDRSVKSCTERWAQKKKDDPKAYECYANCADGVKHIVDLAACMPKCYPNAPKPADETDKLEGVIAFPDAAPSASVSPSASASSSK